MWNNWWEVFLTIPKPDIFLEIFEFINIKSHSEAYFESVGSLMNIFVNKQRNLHPVNFSKELQLAFNAPDFHFVKQTVVPYVVEKFTSEGKMFKRKLEKINQATMLMYTTSASIGNFRNNAEKSYMQGGK